MKKIFLSALLFCTISMIISCDNEAQEDSINENISEKQLIYLGDDLIELEFITGADGELHLSDKYLKKVKDFNKSYPNSIYFIDKDEVRIFKDDIDLGNYLGKDLVNNQDETLIDNSTNISKTTSSTMNKSNWPSVKLYWDKYFNNLVYNRSFYSSLSVSYNNLNSLNLNDATSSFEVFPTTFNLDARFYQHNFSGRSIYVRAYVGYPVRYSDLSRVQMGTWWWNNWNNEISSFTINRS